MEIRSTGNCGIKEYNGIREATIPKNFIQDIYNLVIEKQAQTAIITFSDTTERTNGHAIEKYINDHKLGTVISTNPKRNTNSGNDIILWAWEIDTIALAHWIRPTTRVPGYRKAEVMWWKFKRLLKNLIPHPKLTIPIEQEKTS